MSSSPTTTPNVVALLGLGAMGSRLAARLHDAGTEIVVWNRSPLPVEAFVQTHPVTVAASPRAAATAADIVISTVTDDDASTSVWLDPDTGALAGIGDGVAVEMSTVSPDHVRRLAREAERRGVRLVEAPVVGSRPQADAGALVALVGGDPGLLEALLPTLDLLAGTVHHIGPVGTAATLKLSINGLFAAQVAVFAEIVSLLEASDVDTATARRVISSLPVTSPALQRILSLFETADYSPNFPITLVAKDLGYLCRAADGHGADLPITAHVAAVFERAAHSPAAEIDIAGVITTFETS